MSHDPPAVEFSRRWARFAALGDPVRLALVDDLVTSDRSPAELARRHRLESNLLAHHLRILESTGLISRTVSAGDRRRRYVRLDHAALAELGLPSAGEVTTDLVVFVCTAATARSQLAAALWRRRTGRRAAAAGTSPAATVHPGAVAAGRRAGLDLADAVPQSIEDVALAGSVVVTVCDRAREELGERRDWRHWSVPDPVVAGVPGAFDDCVTDLVARIETLAGAA